MHYSKDLGYMSLIATLNDVNNTFLLRREITCNFTGLAGKLKKLEAVDMITKEFKLDGKFVIPIILKNHVGKQLTTGTFYVYDDENLAKKHVAPTIFKRLEKAQKAGAQAEAPTDGSEEKEVKSKDSEDEKESTEKSE